MSNENAAVKEISEGVIRHVDRDGVDEPSFFVYIEAVESDEKRKQIEAAVGAVENDLENVEDASIECG